MDKAVHKEVEAGHDHDDMNSDDNTEFSYGSKSDGVRR